MDLVYVSLVFVGFCVVLVVSRSAYLRGIEIQETYKTSRSRANAIERSNQNKMNGLFELQLAKVGNADNPEGNELVELVKMFSMMKNGGGGSDPSSPPASQVSWEVMREQLKNPEVKKVILENRDEALKILQS